MIDLLFIYFIYTHTYIDIYLYIYIKVPILFTDGINLEFCMHMLSKDRHMLANIHGTPAGLQKTKKLATDSVIGHQITPTLPPTLHIVTGIDWIAHVSKPRQRMYFAVLLLK